MKKNKEQKLRWQIWFIMPNKLKGVVMGILLLLLVMSASNLLELLHSEIWVINFSMAMIYVYGIFKVSFGYVYPWLTK